MTHKKYTNFSHQKEHEERMPTEKVKFWQHPSDEVLAPAAKFHLNKASTYEILNQFTISPTSFADKEHWLLIHNIVHLMIHLTDKLTKGVKHSITIHRQSLSLINCFEIQQVVHQIFVFFVTFYQHLFTFQVHEALFGAKSPSVFATRQSFKPQVSFQR